MNKTLLIGLFALAISGHLASCARQDGDSVDQAGNEIVMCPGSSIDASFGDRRLLVDAVGPATRRYRIAGYDETAKLIRRKTRWNGSLGIYRPTGIGKLHLILEESLLFFYSEEELYYWLNWKKHFGGHFYYTSDGLLASWSLMVPASDPTSPYRALRVDVHQLLLKGKKPENLAGAQNEAFLIKNPSTNCTVGDPRNSSFVASPPQVVSGRRYSGWAIDIMRVHNIAPETVELALKGDEPTVRDEYRTYHWHPKSGKDWLKAFSVTVDGADSVVFVSN